MFQFFCITRNTFTHQQRGHNRILLLSTSSVSTQSSCIHRPRKHSNHCLSVSRSSRYMPKHTQHSSTLMVEFMSFSRRFHLGRKFFSLPLPHELLFSPILTDFSCSFLAFSFSLSALSISFLIFSGIWKAGNGTWKMENLSREMLDFSRGLAYTCTSTKDKEQTSCIKCIRSVQY